MESQPLPATASGKINWRLVSRGALLLMLLGLCGYGLAVTPFWKQHMLSYWLWMVTGFGGLSVLICLLSDPHRRNTPHWKVLQHQVLQWIGTGAAVYLLFWMIGQKFFNVEAAGPTATILVALSIYLAGISFDGSLVVVALLLGALTVGAAYLEGVMLVVAGLAAILGIALLLLRRVIKNYRSAPAAATPASPSSGTPSILQ